MARNLRPGADWVPAVVVERLGPLTYLVETSERLLWKRHIDHLQELELRDWNSEFPEPEAPDVDIPGGDSQAPPPPLVVVPTADSPAVVRQDPPDAGMAPTPTAPETVTPATSKSPGSTPTRAVVPTIPNSESTMSGSVGLVTGGPHFSREGCDILTCCTEHAQ